MLYKRRPSNVKSKLFSFLAIINSFFGHIQLLQVSGLQAFLIPAVSLLVWDMNENENVLGMIGIITFVAILTFMLMHYN